MNIYKIFKNNWQVLAKFKNEAEALAAADSFGPGYSVEFVAPYNAPTLEERLEKDLYFGNYLIIVFVQDNRNQGINTEQSESILLKFRDILAFAQTGAITSISKYLPAIKTDEVYTEERKAKYIDLINNYLNQF